MSKEKGASQKRKRPMSGGKKALIITLIALVLIVACGSVYALNILGKINTVEFKYSDKELNVTPKDIDKEKGDIKNIALFGIDTFEGDVGRSDAIIIATVDTIHNKLKLTSLIRDTYVSIPNHGYTKLNHAFAYGKEKLAIQTINQNFGLDIQDYVKVNFTGLESIIDEVGGIDITVTEDEIDNFNEHIRSLSKNKGVEPEYIEGTGEHHLNGLQATAYCRIRYANGGDVKRTERQRHVLTLLFDKVSNTGAVKLSSIVSKFLPYVETSLSSSEIISLGTKVLSSNMGELHQETFPHLDYSEDAKIDGIYYRTYDEEVTKKQIHDYIYNDIKPQPKAENQE